MTISPQKDAPASFGEQDQYSDAETIARRGSALKRLQTTPPKPHKEMVRQSKNRPAKKQEPKAS
jgi:hypothetical protein